MKLRTLTILLLLLASITLVSAAEPPILKTTLLRYDPTPAQPGDYITAYIQIENTGGTAQRVRIEFKDSYP
ncbi:hypothetical protein GOV08_01970, partial [Candidatus Woesearchaeota archaeon]|nr:hypothetical protein [Candidatus Woesearchaeota archaeon]